MKLTLDYYILNGKKVIKVPWTEWANWFSTKRVQHIAETFIKDARISTVFLGMDHGYGGKPLLFETMVFGGKLDQEMDRYSTWNEAKAGHDAMVKRVKNAQNKKASQPKRPVQG